MVDGCLSNLVNVGLGVSLSSVLEPLFLLYTSELFSTPENKLYGYADDSILFVVMPSPLDRVAVAESMNRDLNEASELCDLWRMRRCEQD